MDSTVSVEQILETLGKKSADTSPGASVSIPPQTTMPPMFPQREFQAKKKIEPTAFSDNAIVDETGPQAVHNLPPEKKNQETTMSINDEMKREPIINTILDIFDGDLIR